MGKIDTSGWKEFKLGYIMVGNKKQGHGLFEIVNSVAYHGKDVTETDSDDGINYITRSKFNNGLKARVVRLDKFKVNPAGTISFGAENADFFYQTEPYITGNKMYYIDTTALSERACRFLKSILEATFTAKLPATPDCAPDWAYMESYMAYIETKVAESLTLLQAAKDAEKKKVDTRKWGKFHLYDIFSICMGNKFDRSKMCEVDEGINFVGRSALTNGVACAVTSVEDKKGNTVQPYPAGDITIALGGSIGAAFVQDREFYTSQNVCVLHTDNPSITERVKWFVAASITASCGNYEAFTNELNRHIRTDFIIRLPMGKTGQPDWVYMEEYMRKVEEKAKNVLNHFEKDRNGV